MKGKEKEFLPYKMSKMNYVKYKLRFRVFPCCGCHLSAAQVLHPNGTSQMHVPDRVVNTRYKRISFDTVK